MFGMDMMFNKIPNELYPYDHETFKKSKSEFVVVTTNCETGRAEYFTLTDNATTSITCTFRFLLTKKDENDINL